MRSNYKAPASVHAAEHKEIDRVMTIERLYIHQSRTELLSDEESRIKHREWINNPQRDKQ